MATLAESAIRFGGAGCAGVKPCVESTVESGIDARVDPCVLSGVLTTIDSAVATCVRAGIRARVHAGVGTCATIDGSLFGAVVEQGMNAA